MEEEQTEKKSSGYKVNGKAWYIIIVFSVCGLLITPLLFMSSVFASTISQDAMLAASVSLFYSVGCLSGGLIFGKLYAICKRYSFTVSAVCAAAGIILAATAGNVVLLFAGMIIAGLGYSSMMSAAMMIVGLVTPMDSVPFATSMMMAIMNVASFLASSWIGLIANVTGDAVYMPVYVGAVGFVLIAVITAIKKPFPAE